MIRFKHFMVLGAAVSALMVPVHANAVDTIEELAFHPAKNWEVGSIKPVTDYSGECIIQTEFNNGFLLQINGSSNWVQQVNLNIRQNAFEIDKVYDVNLAIPGRAAETIAGKAYRGNIISVPLKGQKELYKSMRDHGVLDLGIEGNDFRFYLTGFNAAAHQFERCMAGGAPGRVAAKNVRAPDVELPLEEPASDGLGGITVSTRDMSDSEKAFLLNESIAFEEQESMVRDAPVLEPVFEEAASTQTDISEEEAVAALNETAAQVAMERAGLEIPSDQNLSETLVEEIETSAGVVEETITIDMDEPAVFEPALAEPEFIEEDIEVSIVDTVAVDSMPETMPIMPKSDMDIAKNLLSEPESAIDMPKIEVTKATARAEADFSKPKLENADSKALARIVALEQELEAARAENESLNDELQTSLREGKQEQMSVQTDNWNLERATMRYNEAERQMKKLGQQLQKERAQHAMEKKELEAMLFDPAVTEQEQLARLSKLEQELAETKAELEEARSAMVQ